MIRFHQIKISLTRGQEPFFPRYFCVFIATSTLWQVLLIRLKTCIFMTRQYSEIKRLKKKTKNKFFICKNLQFLKLKFRCWNTKTKTEMMQLGRKKKEEKRNDFTNGIMISLFLFILFESVLPCETRMPIRNAVITHRRSRISPLMTEAQEYPRHNVSQLIHRPRDYVDCSWITVMVHSYKVPLC